MNKPLKVIKVGNSAGVLLSRELLAKLRVSLGDTLYVSDTPDGGVRLAPSDPDFEARMAMAEDIMREDRDILHILSK